MTDILTRAKRDRTTTAALSPTSPADCSYELKRSLGSINYERVRPAIHDPERWTCTTCDTTKSLWICLVCGKFLCNEREKKRDTTHLKDHVTKKNHAIFMELNTSQHQVYCFASKITVEVDNPKGDIFLIRNHLRHVQDMEDNRMTRTGSPTALKVKDPKARWHELGMASNFAFHLAYFSPRAKAKRGERDHLWTTFYRWRHLLLSQCFNSWKKYCKEIQWQRRKRLESDDLTSMSLTTTTIVEEQIEMMDTTTHESTTTVVPMQMKQTLERPPLKRQNSGLFPGKTGLRNLGNTCYMNAVLQVMSHLDEFKQYILQKSFPKDCRGPQDPTSIEDPDNYNHTNNNNNNNNSSTITTSELSRSMQTVVERLWSSKFAVFSPDTFLSTIWKLFPSLAGFKQQDSDELLRFMLDRFRLEEEQMAELQVDNTRVKSMSSSTLPKKNDRDRQQQGFIDQLFGGTIVHQVFCQKCHQISRQEDNFYGLFSLEIPRIYRSLTHTNGSKSSGGGGGYSSGRRSRRPSQEDPSSGSDSIGSGGNGGRGSAAASKCHLTNCLDAIIEEEQLKEDAQYFCSKCQKKCDAVRQSCLSKIPNIVIFHINRTDWINGCKKIQSFVEFPLTLDLTKYEKTPSSFISSSNTTGTLATPSSRSTSGQYTLRSMIVHDGKSMSQGHYTSFAYNSVLKQWCHFNDHRVKFVDWQEVSKQQAYLLIYGRTSSLPLSRDSTPMPFNSSSSPVQFPPCTTASALAPRRSPRTSLPPSSMAECSFVPPLSLDSAPARKTRKSSFNYS